MALNIKNSEAHALASELARLREVSVTRAVLDAVRHELTLEKDRRKRNGLGKELVAIGERCAAHMGHGGSSRDHAALLYDRRGLPR